ncbi:MAG TPA: hypothetical protein VMV94_06725 [Phycisphaerae bacterium]|nr:hypothetical protein [Phycisphaerae bacterium]
MAVELHVDGIVQRGRFSEFLEAAGRWTRFRKDRGWAEPRLLCGLSGPMNMVRFVFSYKAFTDYEREETLVSQDKDYARIAMDMPFDGQLTFTIFRHAAPA